MNATDPTTPPDVLSSLARSKKTSLQRAVALNPNTPQDVLNRLWERHPCSMLANPILDFWELTEPGTLFERISETALLAVYNHLRKTGQDLPQHIFNPKSLKDLIEHALDHRDIRVFDQTARDPLPDVRLFFVMATIRSPRSQFFYENAPDHVWESLSSDSHPEIRRRFAELLRAAPSHISTPRPAFTEAARALSICGDEDVFHHLAHCPLIPADVVNRLAPSESLEVRRALSRCVDIPPEAIPLLCKDPDESVRLAFAKNCSVPMAHEVLLKDPSQKIRETLAANLRVELPILSQFDIKDHVNVLKKVFQNSRASEQLRSRIFTEADPEVKEVLSSDHPRLRPRFYFAHKNSIPPHILLRITKRTGLHVKIVADLAADPDPEIRLSIANRLQGQYGWRKTKENLELLQSFTTDPNPKIRACVCTDPRLTPKQVADLARDTCPAVRKKVLNHILATLEDHRNSKNLYRYTSLYNETLELFMEATKDFAPSVRRCLANAKETPPEALRILLDDSDPDVRKATLNHDRWPFGAVLDFEKDHPQFKGGTRHGSTTPSQDVLHKFACGPNPFLRYIAAQFSRTSVSDLRSLANDPHPAVREAALKKLKKRQTSNQIHPRIYLGTD